MRRLPSQLTWVISGILLLLGMILPMLIGFFTLMGNPPDRWSESCWLVLNPFAMGFSNHDWFYGGIAVALVLIVTLLNLPWLIARVQAFRPHKVEQDAILFYDSSANS
ncbi:MAG: hypothetical protein HOP19_09040 [Acidobacteria bacterium]|nr:hypothetical protein [Acidobacteriota bacterium]